MPHSAAFTGVVGTKKHTLANFKEEELSLPGRLAELSVKQAQVKEEPDQELRWKGRLDA